MTDLVSDAEAACRRLQIAYARSIDFRDYDAFADLFAIDGVLDTGKALQGRDAIRQSLMRRPDELRSRHVITNPYVEVLDDRTARGMCYLTLFRHHGEESLRAGPVPLGGVAAVGHYEDRFVALDGEWLFARRKLHLAFQNPDFF